MPTHGDDRIDATGSDLPTEELGEYAQSTQAPDTGGEGGGPGPGSDRGAGEQGPREGMTSQTGRQDVADSGMGTGVNPGIGTFAREDDEDGSAMRDAPPDSNLRGSADPSGGGMYPDQSGGEPER